MSDGAVATLLRQTRERAATPEAPRDPFADEEPEAGEEYRAFGEFREGPGFGLDFRFRDGREFELSYAHLFSNDFDPSGTITLLFTGGETVTIRGKNLRPLRASIRRRRAAWVRELSEPEALRHATPAATIVTRIDVQSAPA
jgi:hypothetical protein